MRGLYPLRFDELHVSCPIREFRVDAKVVDANKITLEARFAHMNVSGALAIPLTFTFFDHGNRLPEEEKIQSVVALNGTVFADPASILLRSQGSEPDTEAVTLHVRGESIVPCIHSARSRLKGLTVRFDNIGRPGTVLLRYAPDGQKRDNAVERGEVDVDAKVGSTSYAVSIGVTAMRE